MFCRTQAENAENRSRHCAGVPLESFGNVHGPQNYPSPTVDYVLSSLLLLELCKWSPRRIWPGSEKVLLWFCSWCQRRQNTTAADCYCCSWSPWSVQASIILQFTSTPLITAALPLTTCWSSGHRVSSLGLPQPEAVCVKAKAATCFEHYNGHLSVSVCMMRDITIFFSL